MEITCAVCGNVDVSIITIGGARRADCPACLHEQRVDIEAFDYADFAMGATGAGETRLQGQVEFLSRHLPLQARILEIGCAAGILAEILRPRLAPRAYHGIELSPARDIAARMLDTVFDATLPDLLRQERLAVAAYDVIITSHCLEHITDIDAEIASIRKVLAPQGALFVEVPNRSGHPTLPFDDNRSHLHFFSVSSLTRLLAKHGLAVTVMETGAWHDARYPDCIRAIARPVAYTPAVSYPLSAHPRLAGVENLIVWGAGKMVPEMLVHYFDPEKIKFFVDKDERKHNTICLGRPVKPLDAINTLPSCTILINSLEYEKEISKNISDDFGEYCTKTISIGELLSEI